MKKILLGLLVVSAIAMGATTANSDGSTSVHIETKAFIVDGGLIIDGGNLDGNKIVLDHGVLMKGDTANSQRIATTNIKKSGENATIPAGTGIELSVTGDHILKNNGNTASLGHTLEIATENDSTGILLPSKGKLSYIHTVGANGVEAIPVTVKSTITAGHLSAVSTEGQYTNTVTLNVRYSKLGTEIAVPLKK